MEGPIWKKVFDMMISADPEIRSLGATLFVANNPTDGEVQLLGVQLDSWNRRMQMITRTLNSWIAVNDSYTKVKQELVLKIQEENGKRSMAKECGDDEI